MAVIIVGGLFISNIKVIKPGNKAIIVFAVLGSLLILKIFDGITVSQKREGDIMRYAERNGKRYEEENRQDQFLEKLYNTYWGRFLLKPLTSRIVSNLGGKLLDTSLSRLAIRPFIKANQIPMEDYKKTIYKSYNDFFTRQIRPEKKTIFQRTP